MIGLLFLAFSIVVSLAVSLPHGVAYAGHFALGNFLIASSFLFAARNAYRLDRLLEPATFFMGTQYISYGPANWWPVTGVHMFISNPGSLDYYPEAAVLGGMAMWVYILSYISVRKRYDPRQQISSVRVSYWSLLALNLGCVILYFVLSQALGQVRGFEGAGKGLTGPVNWIALAFPPTVYAVTVSVPFYWNRHWSLSRKLLISLAVLGNVVVMSTFSSRTSLLVLTGTFFMIVMQRTLIAHRLSSAEERKRSMQTSSQAPFVGRKGLTFKKSGNKILKTVLVSAISLVALVGAYIGGTFVKAGGIAQEKLAGTARLEEMAKMQVKSETLWESAGVDLSYRMACLEMPAAILASQMKGTDWLWGDSFLLGLKGSLPNFLSSALGLYKDKIQEKVEVEADLVYHFGLVEVDQTGSVLASAVGDFGPLGIFIFFPLLALFHGIFLLRLYINPATTIAYFGTLWCVTLFDHFIATQLFDLLKFLGFSMLILLPFTIWQTRKALPRGLLQ